MAIEYRTSESNPKPMRFWKSHVANFRGQRLIHSVIFGSLAMSSHPKPKGSVDLSCGKPPCTSHRSRVDESRARARRHESHLVILQADNRSNQ